MSSYVEKDLTEAAENVVPRSEQIEIEGYLSEFAEEMDWKPRIVSILIQAAKRLPLNTVKTVFDNCVLHNASSPAYYRVALDNAYKGFTASLKNKYDDMSRALKVLVTMRDEGKVLKGDFLKSDWLRDHIIRFKTDKENRFTEYSENMQTTDRLIAVLQEKLAEIKSIARQHQ